MDVSRSKLEDAVKEYVNCAEVYRCTPLQLEILNRIVKNSREDLLEMVVEASSKIHGSESTQLHLIAALAENGMHKPIYKLLMVNYCN